MKITEDELRKRKFDVVSHNEFTSYVTRNQIKNENLNQPESLSKVAKYFGISAVLQGKMEKLNRKDWGVAPNIEVELRSDELKKMIEVQRNNDVLVKANHDDTNDDFKKHTIEETLAADPQLAVGLLIVQSKLIQDETLAQAHLVN